MIETSTNTGLYVVLGGIISIFIGAISYGFYNAFGPGSKKLVDPISEHARMHAEGIPHGHGGGSSFHQH